MIKTITLESGDVVICNWNTIGHLAGWIETLFATSQKLKDCGALTALVLDASNKIFVHGGFITPRLHAVASRAMGESFYNQFPGTQEVQVSHFICGIIKKDLIKKLPLPENLGTNPFVDADYCLEAQKLGFKIYATSDLIVQFKGYETEEISEAKKAEAFETQYAKFNEKWGRSFDLEMKTPVMYHTSVGQPSGFAKAARGYIRGLINNKVRVAYNYLRGTNEEEDEGKDEVINSICEDHGDLKMPQVIWGQAPFFNKNSGVYKIGHCEFEGEVTPPEWIEWVNEMDELWVPTNWDREKFRRAGAHVPIYTFAQGIDKNYFHPDYAPMTFEVKENYKFICNAAWDPRKNLEKLIQAFKIEFRKDEDVCLIIKTINLGLVNDIKDEVKKIKFNKDSAHVYIKEDQFAEEELPSFYTGGDCFVLPSHGEGWGLPLFEALACGIPVITTGWGAPFETLTNEKEEALPGVHFLKCTKSVTNTPYVYLQGNFWAEPSIPDLQKTMREVYTNRVKEKEGALKTSELIRAKFDWDEITKPIKERITEIYKTKL